MNGEQRVPKVFISYSWDNEPHKRWVKEFAAGLRRDGVDVTLDQWHVRPGDQLPAFMEQSVRDNDFVLIICTPVYKRKSEARAGGVGYEGDVIQGEVFVHSNHRKFVPILRGDDWIDSAPSKLVGKAYISLREGPDYRHNYEILLRNLHSMPESLPPIGSKPDLSRDHVTAMTPCDLKGHMKPVVRVAAIADKDQIASLDQYGQVIIWDTRRNVCVRMISTGFNYHGVFAVAQSERNAIALESGKYPHNIALYDLEVDNPPLVFEDTELESRYGYQNDLVATAATPDLGLAVTGSKRGQIAVWDLKKAVKLWTIQAFDAKSHFDMGTHWKGGVNHLVISEDGSRVVTTQSEYDSRIHVWDIRRGVQLHKFPAPKEFYWHEDDASTRVGFQEFCLTPDGTRLLTGDLHGGLRIWDLETGLLLRELPGRVVRVLAISPDGGIAATSGVTYGPEVGRITLWDLGSGAELDHRWYHSGPVHTLSISVDSRFVISGGEDTMVRIREIAE